MKSFIGSPLRRWLLEANVVLVLSALLLVLSQRPAAATTDCKHASSICGSNHISRTYYCDDAHYCDGVHWSSHYWVYTETTIWTDCLGGIIIECPDLAIFSTGECC